MASDTDSGGALDAVNVLEDLVGGFITEDAPRRGMRIVDGRTGGGQLVRTAVATSAVTGEPIRMKNVRGARDQPGLRAQHVAAIETVAAISHASTEGVHLGAEEFEFEPAEVSGGSYDRSIGTAGSLTLVFDAILPLALRLEDPASVRVRGGTDVKWAPPFDYLQSVKLPVLRSLGFEASTALHRRGFYPSGGGTATLTMEPSSLEPLDLAERGDLKALSVHSCAATALESADVADRQAETAADRLETIAEVPVETEVSYDLADDKGSVIVVVATFESSIAGFSALGEPGKPSEAVATTAVDRFEGFQETSAAVDGHLADQLIPYLAIGGGRIRIPQVTDHVETHLSLVSEFDFSVTLERLENGEAILEADGNAGQGTIP